MRAPSLDMFAKLDSDICIALKDENSDYRELLEAMAAIVSSRPALLAFWDQDAAVALSAQDVEAFQSYRKLQREAEDMERYAIYQRGYHDGVDSLQTRQPE